VNRRQFIKGAGGLFVPAAPALLFPKQAKAARWLPLFKQASGGGGPSFVFRGGQNQNGLTLSDSNTVATYAAMNLGTGSQFVILGIASQGEANPATITSLTVNGVALTSIVSDVSLGGIDTIYAGTVTATGSDVIVVTNSASIEFDDLNVGVWTATGLTSTTPLTSKPIANANTAFTVPAAVGNFIFAFNTNAGLWVSPTGITNETAVTGDNGFVSQPGDVTVTAGMISGGNVTLRATSDNPGVVAVWD
jgi:hypothetical protein